MDELKDNKNTNICQLITMDKVEKKNDAFFRCSNGNVWYVCKNELFKNFKISGNGIGIFDVAEPFAVFDLVSG